MGNQASHADSPAGAQMEDYCPSKSTVTVTISYSSAVALGNAAHIPGALPVAVGLAILYGKKLATDPNPACDPFCLRPKLERMSRSIDSLKDLYDRGMLMSYMMDSIECLGRPGLSERQVRVRPEPRSVELCKMPILYKTKTVGSKVYIAKEDIPAFLQDNGIPMMNAEEVGDHLKSKLAAYFPISEFSCVGKYDIHGKVVVGSLGSPNNMAGLKPGEARYKIKINEDFSKYTADPSAYEKKLKECILQALGLDHTKIPGAKKHLKVEYAKAGSVEIGIVIGAAILGGAALVGLVGFITYYCSRRPDQSESTSGDDSKQDRTQALLHALSQSDDGRGSSSQSPVTPSNSTRRLVTRVEYRTYGDDDWAILCQFHETPQCYLPDTMFRAPTGGFKTAHELCEGDKVVGSDGETIDVMSKEVFQSKKRTLQTLRTAQAEITVTSSHRVVVMEGSVRSERMASDLKAGDVVLCGKREQQLTRVIRSERDTEVVQLGFYPDAPVQTFNAPHWPILTLGNPHHVEVGSFGPLGPRRVDELPEDPVDGMERPRTA